MRSRAGHARARRTEPHTSGRVILLTVLLGVSLLAIPGALASTGDGGSYLLMPRAELLSLPVSGRAWNNLLARATGDWPVADLKDQDNKHGVHVLAAALVYARTGDAALRARAVEGIRAVMPTWQPIGRNGVLSIGRQLGAYVLAADLARLDCADETAFRAFLGVMLTSQLGTHGRWQYLKATHEDANNNWGGFAGASRIAASLYLGDRADVSRAALVLRGFLGDRSAYANFKGQKDDIDQYDKSWACDGSRSGFVPGNGSCKRNGLDLSGGIPADVSREGVLLAWPPSKTGVSYQLGTLQGLIVQAELLQRNGHAGIWHASDTAIRRAADLVKRSQESGGPGWNESSVKKHVPWLLNFRYGT